jgi:hypothetical protein
VLPQAQDPRPAPRIGRYRITGRIGKGGMGMVYRGLDESLEREVAVKTLVAEGSFDPDSRRRFEIEARAAAKLAHPNIVTVHELGEDRGILFIAMEMLPGVDLESLLRAGESLPLAEKLDVVAQVCRGLAFAHERGIVHRDIKPSNVRLLDDGTTKIMDFGIAKLGADHHITKTGMMVGTVHYMSPEQVRGRPLDGRTDVFSAGVILYELLAGERPFRGDDVTAILYKIVNEEPPVPELAATGELAPRLRQVLDRALAKDPAVRYSSAAAFADELGALSAQAQGAPRPGTQDALVAARRALGDGRVEEAVARLRALAAEQPESVETRRALRAALREQKRREEAQPAGDGTYPELDATFQAALTRRDPAAAAGTPIPVSQDTALAPTVVVPKEPAAAPAAPPAADRRWLWIGGAFATVAVGAVVVLLRPQSRSPERPEGPAPAAEVRIPIRTQPAGASVWLDGRDTGLVTDGELRLPPPLPPQLVLTLKRTGHPDVTRTLQLPLPAGGAAEFALGGAPRALPVRTQPPGATVTLDGAQAPGVTPLELKLDAEVEHRVQVALEGYAAQDVRLKPGGSPAALDLALLKQLPPGSLAVSSPYAVDVVWRGRSLAKGESSPRVPLASGRQQVTLVAASVFLKADFTVEVPAGGEATLTAPELGRLNVRATPENCQVFVDDVFVDYPPIRERPLAAGRHNVSFKWPDGKQAQQTVEVKEGKPAFVEGRKE